MIPKAPRWMLFTGVLAAMALAVPPFIIARVRATPDENRAVHIFFDMDFQPKFKTQSVNPLFADGRSQRPSVLGTVAHGENHLDTHRFEGAVNGKWADTLPEGMTMSKELLERGQQRFNIYCAVCHDRVGTGRGHDRSGGRHQHRHDRRTRITPWPSRRHAIPRVCRTGGRNAPASRRFYIADGRRPSPTRIAIPQPAAARNSTFLRFARSATARPTAVEVKLLLRDQRTCGLSGASGFHQPSATTCPCRTSMKLCIV